MKEGTGRKGGCGLTRKRLLSRVLLGLLMATAGCSLFSPYSERMGRPLRDFETGRLEAAYGEVEKHLHRGKDRLLYLLEGGMIRHGQARLDDSNAVFTEADQVMQAFEGKAVVSASEVAAQGASLLVNEKTLPYEGQPFEKVLVYTYKALNYLLLHEYEEARVEVRRSFAQQQQNRKLHKKKIERIDAEARARQIQAETLTRRAASEYQGQKNIVRQVTNPYEDPFAYYLSALVYEFYGEYNDAFIDLKKVQELRPGVPYVENDLLRMAERSGLREEARAWEERLGRSPRFLREGEEGEMLIFFECGMAPRKEEIKIPLPIPTVGILALAFPKYQPVPSPFAGAALYSEGGWLEGETYVLTDVEAIAMRDLQDQLPILVLKQVLRASAKGAVARTAREEGGVLGAVAVDLYNIFSEQADLRSWTTLPKNVQVARIPLGTGVRQLVFALEDGQGVRLQERVFTVEVLPGQRVFLEVRTGTEGLISFHTF